MSNLDELKQIEVLPDGTPDLPEGWGGGFRDYYAELLAEKMALESQLTALRAQLDSARKEVPELLATIKSQAITIESQNEVVIKASAEIKELVQTLDTYMRMMNEMVKQIRSDGNRPKVAGRK